MLGARSLSVGSMFFLDFRFAILRFNMFQVHMHHGVAFGRACLVLFFE